MNFESNLIRHCSPTLAGLKTGNLFNIECFDDDSLDKTIDQLNATLNHKDVYIRKLRENDQRALIYVFRKNKLKEDLNQKDAKDFVEEIGYDPNNIDSCIDHLNQRIEISDGFPHEIGLFLSYPFEDVDGFIRHNGYNCKFCGCWKVYANELEKKILFEKFKECSKEYSECYLNGMSIRNLTVAS